MSGESTLREPIRSEASVFHVRKRARELAVQLGFDAVRAAELETAVSEVAQNAWHHAGGGAIELTPVHVGGRTGLHVLATDDGPGIAEVERVLRGGYSTARRLGLGVSACTRLMDEVEIDSVPGHGTRVSMWKWSRGAPPALADPPTHTSYAEIGEVVNGRDLPFGSLEWARGARIARGNTTAGDRGLVKLTAHGELVAVADGAGSGEPAAAAAERALACAARHCDRDPALILDACHEALKATVGAALTVVSVDVAKGTLSWAGIGNVEAMVTRADRNKPDEALVCRSGMLGVRIPKLCSECVPIEVGDALLVWTDGIRSRAVHAVDRRGAVGEIAHDILMLGSDGCDDALVLVARYEGGTIW